MPKEITLPVIVAGLSTLKDGSVKIVLETQELTPDKAGQVYGLQNKEAWVVISPEEISEVNIPTEKPDPILGKKSASQRLRSVIFVYWKQIGSKADFDTFYNATVEKYIDIIKERLDQ